MKKLKELHRNIKYHKFRLARDKRYAKSYGILLRNFLKEFEEMIKEKGMEDRKGIWLFLHEALSNAFHFESGDNSFIEYYKDGLQMDKDIMIETEKTIGDIHKFILTGKFDSFHTYYTGSNVGKGGRDGIWKYNPKTNTYKGNWK